MDYKDEQDVGKKAQIAGFLVDARKRLNDASDALMKGPGGYTDKDAKEAIVALTPDDKMFDTRGGNAQ